MSVCKKIILMLLMISLALSMFACGNYRGPVNNGSSDLPDGSVDQPALDDDPTNDFTVKLRLNGEPYSPATAVSVYWTDGYNIHIAPVDSTGTATIDGLDGDYKVTLSSVPSGYAYDTNAYTATNYNRNIVIDMYDLNLVQGTGTTINSCYRVNSTGIYSVTIGYDFYDVDRDGSDIEKVYFEFSPQVSGTYTIESWVNVTEDAVNPIAIAYLGSSQYKHSPYEVTDLGACGSFTRNFVHTVEIASEMISSGGSQTFSFAITAETKSGVYPVTFSFAIKRNGDFDLNRIDKTHIAPEFDWTGFDFDAFNALATSGKSLVGAQTPYKEGSTSMVFDQRNYKVWEKSEGGDGIYHVYDPDKYPETNGYGPMLVGYITEPCDYLGASLTTIEDAGNNALVVSQATENYRQFIKGFDAVASAGYYCMSNCPCHSEEPPGSPRACMPGCTGCTPSCSPCPEQLMHKEGYASYCNADGVAPVTPELAEFFQKFAINGQYFADGEGHVDRGGIYAYEDSQWLFICAYYTD